MLRHSSFPDPAERWGSTDFWELKLWCFDDVNSPKVLVLSLIETENLEKLHIKGPSSSLFCKKFEYIFWAGNSQINLFILQSFLIVQNIKQSIKIFIWTWKIRIPVDMRIKYYVAWLAWKRVQKRKKRVISGIRRITSGRWGCFRRQGWSVETTPLPHRVAAWSRCEYLWMRAQLTDTLQEKLVRGWRPALMKPFIKAFVRPKKNQQ